MSVLVFSQTGILPDWYPPRLVSSQIGILPDWYLPRLVSSQTIPITDNLLRLYLFHPGSGPPLDQIQMNVTREAIV
ncbi:hypothetical protein Bpfe_019265 [Biomphalaria pfeifferi]|uniref:Uncharacterized protein n=1 Tax=Biomphalaria pfeifferi TaxID=112525 RepID=A0AAD8F603_BIOPF|nr:hypothetical protein Bpfe_019265 [Biomphalaria pfeifferi]